jgi:hypothetical protein
MNIGSALASTFGSIFRRGTPEDAGNPVADMAQSKVTELWLKVKNQYTSYHQAAMIALIMYAGQLWIRWDMNRRMYVMDIPDDDYVPTPQINRFSPAIDSICSNFNAVPDVQITARKEDDGDGHEIADVANDLCMYFFDTCGLNSDTQNDDDKAGEAAQLFVMAGNVFSEVYAEKVQDGEQPVLELQTQYGASCPNCGYYEKLPQPPPQTPVPCPQCMQPGIFDVTTVSEPLPKLDETSGQPILEPIWKYHIRCKIGDPMSAYPRPGSKGMANTPFFIWAERMALDEVRQRLGSDIDIQADSEMPDGWSVQLEQQLQYYYQGFMSGVPQNADACMVIRMIVLPPNKNNPGMIEFPQGLDCWYSSGKVLKAEVFSEPDHPFTHGRYQRIPKLFFGRSIAFDLANIQKEINGYESLIKLHAQASSCEPICYDENTVTEGSITNRGDKVIKFRSNGPNTIEPFRLKHEVLSPIIPQKLQGLHDEMQNISGAVNVIRGQQEGDITAASAISQLRSEAERAFTKPVNNWNDFWKQTFFKMLRLAQKYFSLQDLIAIVGENKRNACIKFISADLETTVKFTTSQQGPPRSRDELRQEMMQLFDQGALDVNDIHVCEKLFELFGETGMFQTFNADATRARLENKVMRSGQAVEVKPELEDLAVHLSIHLAAVKSLGFDQLDPQAQQIFIEHILQTQAAMVPPAPLPTPGAPNDKPALSKNKPQPAHIAPGGNVPTGPAPGNAPPR